MQVNVTGKIVAVLAKKNGVSKSSGKEWQSQEYVMQESDSEKIICFNVFGDDRINQYGLKVGMNVSVTCEVESREWQGRYFASIRCVQCFTMNQVTTNVQEAPTPQQQEKNETNGKSSVDDLPF